MSQTTLKPTKKRPKPDTEDEDSEGDPSLHDDSLLSNTPPSAKRPKKAPGPKKIGAKPLREVENEAIAEAIDASMILDGVDEPKAKKGSKSTETYQKVSSPWIGCSIEHSALQLCSSPNSNTSSSAQILISGPSKPRRSRCGYTTVNKSQWK